ncbi:hypothetical protein ACH4UT_34060 [Streptomyces sp. NPDC020799]|uniref:hypothetical protein n=1 Tax=Streptomyces sp. NPDC020799 TaxID=3365091 RepID=UPI0037B23427
MAFLLLHLFAYPEMSYDNDSYRYARQAYEVLGNSREQAQDKALEAFCAQQIQDDRGRKLLSQLEFRSARVPGAYGRCLAASPRGLAPTDKRYEEIFNTRPLYPVLAAPLVGLLGAKAGLTAVSLTFTAVGGIFILCALNALGLSPGPAFLGQCVYYATPLAYWGSMPLAEGPLLAMLAAILWGAVLLLQRRTLPGALLYAGAVTVSAGVKYSSTEMAALFMAAAAGTCLICVRRVRHRGTSWLFGLSAAAAAAAAAGIKLLRLPGMTATLQDIFSWHWNHPEVPDPWGSLIRLDGHFWWQWLQQQAMNPLMLTIALIAMWALARQSVPLALILLALGGIGIASSAVHPLMVEADRLQAPLWLIACAGIPVLMDQVTRGLHHRITRL